MDRLRYYVGGVIAGVLEMAVKAAHPRVILDRAGGAPYLTRLYLLGRPRTADGSSPFDERGNLRPGVVDDDAPFGLYLHKFHKPDRVDWLHNHPWSWACSWILSGGYVEVRRAAGEHPRMRELRPFDLNYLAPDIFHAVAALGTGEASGEVAVWSLFLVGPRRREWGFLDSTDRYVSWREFLRRPPPEAPPEGGAPKP